MKNAKILTGLLVLAALLPGTQALAHHYHHHHHDCVTDQLIFRDKNVVKVEACLPGQPLELAAQWASYSNLNDNPYFVKYWHGSYIKAVTVESRYWREVYDHCTDELLARLEISKQELETREFSVENPNLSQEVKATYELLPLTDTEAKESLAKAKTQCDGYQVP